MPENFESNLRRSQNAEAGGNGLKNLSDTLAAKNNEGDGQRPGKGDERKEKKPRSKRVPKIVEGATLVIEDQVSKNANEEKSQKLAASAKTSPNKNEKQATATEKKDFVSSYSEKDIDRFKDVPVTPEMRKKLIALGYPEKETLTASRVRIGLALEKENISIPNLEKASPAQTAPAPSQESTPPPASNNAHSEQNKAAKKEERNPWGDALKNPEAARAWMEKMGMKGAESTYAEKKKGLEGAVNLFVNREKSLQRRLTAKLQKEAAENDPVAQEYREAHANFRRAQQEYFAHKRSHITNTGMWNALWKKDTSSKGKGGQNAEALYEDARQKFESKTWEITKKRIDSMSAQEWERLHKIQGVGMSMTAFKAAYEQRKINQALGLIANHTTIREAGILEREVIAESFANRKQSGAEKAVRGFGKWYGGLSTGKKYAISMGVGGLLMLSTVGVGGVAVGAGALVARKTLGFAGGAAGAAVGKWVGGIASRFYGKAKRESATYDLNKERSVRHGTRSDASRKDIMQLLAAKETIERNEKLITGGATLAGAVALGGSAAIYGPDLLSTGYDKLSELIPSEGALSGQEAVSVTVKDGQGAISMFSELKGKLAEQYPDPNNAPEVVKRVLQSDAGTLAQEHGFWNTSADAPGGNGLESGLIEKGARLEITDRGELMFVQGGDRAEAFLLDRDSSVNPTPAAERDFAGQFTDGNRSIDPNGTEAAQNTPVERAGHAHTAEEQARWAKEARFRDMIDRLPESVKNGATSSPEYGREIVSFIKSSAELSPEHAREAGKFLIQNQQSPELFEGLGDAADYLEPNPSLEEALNNDLSHKPHAYLLKNGEYAIFSNPDANMSAADTYKIELKAAAEVAKETGRSINVPYESGREYARVLPDGEVRTYGGILGSPPKWLDIDNAVLEVPVEGEVAAEQTIEAVTQAQNTTPIAPVEASVPAPETPVADAPRPASEQVPATIEQKLADLKPTTANGLEGAVPGTELRSGVQMFKAEDWTKMKYWADDNNLYVVGESTNKDPGFAMQIADMKARANVATLIGKTSVDLSGSAALDYWTDPKTGKTFSLIQVPKSGIR